MSSKVITTLLVRNRKFYIVFHQEHYCAIEDRYLDKEMKLTQSLNGFQMHAEKKLQDCIISTRNAVEVAYLVDEEGYDFNDALNKVYALD